MMYGGGVRRACYRPGRLLTHWDIVLNYASGFKSDYRRSLDCLSQLFAEAKKSQGRSPSVSHLKANG